jgi:hypothetical protein
MNGKVLAVRNFLGMYNRRQRQSRKLSTRSADVLLFFLVAATAQNVLGRTIVVHSTADSGPGSLRQALIDAAHGDKINIVARGTITLTGGEMVVAKNVEIKGHGADKLAISGNGTSRVFHIMPNLTVIIERIKITNGLAGGSSYPANAGGGIYSDHAHLTIRDCIVSGNSARRMGGGIFNNTFGGGSGRLTVVNTTINDNSAERVVDGNFFGGFGGGIFNGGGFISASPSGEATLTLTGSTVTRNSAAVGGGIFNDGFSGTATATINTSNITNNTVIAGDDARGGGIYNNGDSGVAALTLTDSTVNGNSAGDVPTQVPGEDGEPAFIHNIGNGGGIYNDGTASLTPGNAQVTLEHSTVSDNVAHGPPELADGPAGNGGGIYNIGDSGIATIRLTDSAVTGNTAGVEGERGNGGGIYNIGTSSSSPGNAELTLVYTIVSDNRTRGRNDAFDQAGYGGGIYNSATLARATATLTDSRLENNSAEEAGGGIFNIGDSGEALLKLTDCRVTGNQAGGIGVNGHLIGAGGGISNLGVSWRDPETPSNVRAVLFNTLVNENVAGFGGGVSSSADDDATWTITNCDLNDNHGWSGGAINLSGGSMTITDSRILRNRADAGGGGIANSTSHVRSTLTISKSTISQNSAPAGGGIANGSHVDGFAELKVDKSTISDNHAAAGGGLHNGAYLGIAIATITNSTLSGNSAEFEPGPGSDTPPGGGGVLNECNRLVQCSAEVRLVNSTLSGNSTIYKGGGILNYRQNSHEAARQRVTLDNCSLSGNSADNGGDNIWNELAPDPDPPGPPPPCPTPPPGFPPCPPPSPPPHDHAILELSNTILNGGYSGGGLRNVLGTLVSRGYNLSSDGAGGDGGSGPGGLLDGPGDIRNTNPLLGPLRNNGGPTRTHALLSGSPAIDRGDPGFNPNIFTPPMLYDQRGPGFLRVVNGRLDIGAFEARRP